MVVVIKKPCPVCGLENCQFTGMRNFKKIEVQCKSCGTKSLIENEKFSTEDIIEFQKLIVAKTGRAAQIDVTFINSKSANKKAPEPKEPIRKVVPAVKTAKSDSPITKRTLNTFENKLHRVIKGYVKRPSQIELAEKIANALDMRGKIITEAGVGTGKSIAYLIPSVCYIENNPHLRNRPVIISTKTTALQDQLANKDIPALKKIFPSIDSMVAKGQSNYVCIKRFRENKSHIKDLMSPEKFTLLEKWILEDSIMIGQSDKSSCPVSTPPSIWDLVSVQNCGLEDCPFERKCVFSFYKLQRKSFSGIIVTNHNLLIDDVIIRKDRDGLWPQPSLVIIDEAHALESSVRSELSQEISIIQVYKLQKNCRNIKALERYVSQGIYEKVDKELDALIDHVEGLHKKSHADEQGDVYIENTLELINYIRKFYGSLLNMSKAIDYAFAGRLTIKEEKQIEKMFNQLERFISKIEQWLENPDIYFISCSKSRDNLIIKINPIDIAGFLKTNLWGKLIPFVFTSGTLSENESFGHIRKKLGLPNIREFIASTSISVKENVAFYIANDMPLPKTSRPSKEFLDDDPDEDFIRACANRVVDLLKCSGGRCLVLFTSHRRLNRVYDLVSRRRDVTWRILHQRDADALNIFRRDKTSVLMATGSFWEGIDVIGDALNMVIMDKLPFPSPSNALIAAKERELKKAGKSDRKIFSELYLPEMLLLLKQGSGRLLRSETDWGAIAILDPRANSPRYNEMVLKCMPPHTRIKDIDSLYGWFNKKKRERGLAG